MFSLVSRKLIAMRNITLYSVQFFMIQWTGFEFKKFKIKSATEIQGQQEQYERCYLNSINILFKIQCCLRFLDIDKSNFQYFDLYNVKNCWPRLQVKTILWNLRYSFFHLLQTGCKHYSIQQKIGRLISTVLVFFASLIYRKVASTNKSRLEAHVSFFRLSMRKKFDVYLL